MAEEFRERRRTPRTSVGGGQAFTLGRRMRVRVVDVSANGALLASEEALPAGLEGRLQLSLAGARFEADVRVVRQHAAGKEQLAGAVVAPAQPRHQEALDDFLRRAGD